MPDTWIFQANPDTFDIDGYLRAASVITWTVRQRHLADRITVGDRVFIWRAQGSGKEPSGVIAAGYILEPPRVQVEQAAARPFWRKPLEVEELRVVIRIERHAINTKEIVRRDWLMDDPVLAGLRILKMANETNYAIEREHRRRLEALWRNTGRDWNEGESIAGLWAYAHTSGGEVSRKPGSPVAEVALRIGRAVSGVYNKVMTFRHLDPTDQRAGLSRAGEVYRKAWAAFFDASTHQLDVARLDVEHARLWGPGGEAAPLEPEAPEDAEGSTPAGRRAWGQGHEADPAVRLAVEGRAMEVAEAHYRALGFDVQNTATTEPYDLRCIRDGLEVRVEVKGTRGNGAEIELTIGEVLNARGNGWRTDLFVVSSIEIERAGDGPSARGGTFRRVEGWCPSDADLTAIRFRCVVPEKS